MVHILCLLINPDHAQVRVFFPYASVLGDFGVGGGLLSGKKCFYPLSSVCEFVAVFAQVSGGGRCREGFSSGPGQDRAASASGADNRRTLRWSAGIVSGDLTGKPAAHRGAPHQDLRQWTVILSALSAQPHTEVHLASRVCRCQIRVIART